MEAKHIHPSLNLRKIIHVDMDAFFASIEVRDDPKLRGLPVAVGGLVSGRGVIATCNYEARAFGVRSAMPTAKALKLCPHLILRPPRFSIYREVSSSIQSIFKSYSDAIEPMSLDEAYLDVSHQSGRTATSIAQDIKQEIHHKTNLTASCGVAPNKMLAKIASDVRKPDGITVVTPIQAFDFMQNLKVSLIPGIGPRSTERLEERGIIYCRDVLQHSEVRLKQWYGTRFGAWLYLRAQGLDFRELSSERVRKSLGAERTFPENLTKLDMMEDCLRPIVDELVARLRQASLRGRTLTIKIKYADFRQQCKGYTLPFYTDKKEATWECARNLLHQAYQDSRAVRLLGVSFSDLSPSQETPNYQQPLLFDSL